MDTKLFYRWIGMDLLIVRRIGLDLLMNRWIGINLLQGFAEIPSPLRDFFFFFYKYGHKPD